VLHHPEEIRYTGAKDFLCMDNHSWITLLSRLVSFGFVIFMGFFFLGDTGWVILLLILGAMVLWWRHERATYQCPECKKYFYRDYIAVEIMEQEGWLKSGKTKSTYKCKQCGHEWTRYLATASILTSFLNG
jgi:predicted RNA-binding Zn-ribbon protein involved in translation (DUF1610 family)